MAIPHDIKAGDTSYIMTDIADKFLLYFERYYPSTTNIADKPNASIGYPLVLENTSFTIDWDKLDITWNFLDTNANHIFDFEPSDSVVTNAQYYIHDTVSGDVVGYTAVLGDDKLAVMNGLKDAWDAKAAATDIPWTNFYTEIVQKVTGYAFRVKGLSIPSTMVQFNFYTSVSSAGTSLDMKIITLSGLYTWDTIIQSSYYEIEWTISKEQDDNPAYYYNVRGNVSDYNKLPMILPYYGNYDVELRLFDLFNQSSSLLQRDIIQVISREVEFMGFYKAREEKYYWDLNNTITWEEYNSYWDLALLPNTDITYADLNWYEALDRSNSLPNRGLDSDQHIQTYQHSGDLSYRGPYYWNNLTEGSWNDMYHIWWDGSNITGDTPAFFKLTSVSAKDSLLITFGTKTGAHAFTTFDLSDAAIELNASTDDIISRFVYNIVKDESGTSKYIQGVGKYSTGYCDFDSVVGSGAGVQIEDSYISRTYNPTWNDINLLKDGKILPKMIYITFGYDGCKIVGKTNSEWTISNVSDDTFSDVIIRERYLNYMFTVPGNYTISLMIEDSNGNKLYGQKNALIIE